MFETEDMLPRTAPKPSCAPTSEMAKMSVPEVSILFGTQTKQQAATAANNQNAQTVQNKYAQWKLDNLVPAKQKTTGAGIPTQLATATAAAEQLHSLNGLLVAQDNAHFATQQRRSLEQQQQQQQQQQTKLPMPRRMSANAEPLTICATTQTDAVEHQHQQQQQHNCVTQQDFEQLFAIIVKMREEQLRLTQICETIFVRQQQMAAQTAAETVHAKPQLQDAQTQYETTATALLNDRRAPQLMRNYMAEVERLERNKTALYNHLPSPLAKSTVYQQNDSPTKRQVDKSLYMNNLASKYLPTQRFNEMLQDMQLPAAKAMQTNAYARSPSDLSTASIQYLQKYRLLPEEEQQQQQQQQFQTEHAPISDVSDEDLMLRCIKAPQRLRCDSPLREQHQNYYRSASPMAAIIDEDDDDSCSAGAGGDRNVEVVKEQANVKDQDNLLNLEQIRRQPKFL